MVDWKELKETMSMIFWFLPAIGFVGVISEHDLVLRYGSILEVIGCIIFYIIVRIKASKKQVYTSEGKLLDDKLGEP